MVAAKEKILSLLSVLTLVVMAAILLVPTTAMAATASSTSVIKTTSIYDSSSNDKISKLHYGSLKKFAAFELGKQQRFARHAPGQIDLYLRRMHQGPGMIYFRARLYDPTTGEFTSRDPLEYVDGMSMMRGYKGIHKIDPYGNAVLVTRRDTKGAMFRVGCNEDSQVDFNFSSDLTDPDYYLEKVIVQKVNVRCRYKKKCCDRFVEHNFFYFEAFFANETSNISNAGDWYRQDRKDKGEVEFKDSSIHLSANKLGVVFLHITSIGVVKSWVTNHRKHYPYHSSLTQLISPLNFRPPRSRDGKWRQDRLHRDPSDLEGVCAMSGYSAPTYPTNETPPFWNSSASHDAWGTRNHQTTYKCGCGSNRGFSSATFP